MEQVAPGSPLAAVWISGTSRAGELHQEGYKAPGVGVCADDGFRATARGGDSRQTAVPLDRSTDSGGQWTGSEVW